jgi:hypothetical protein
LTRLVSLPAALLVAACAGSHSQYPVGQGIWGERMVVDVVALPGVWMRVEDENQATPADDSVDATGLGAGVRIGLGNRDQSVGLLYHGAFLEVEDSSRDVDAHAFYLDFDVDVFVGDKTTPVWVNAGAGLGLVTVDYDSPFPDSQTGASNLRFGIELRPAPGFGLNAGVGGFAWGHPGETEAYGLFFQLGARLHF